VGSGSVYVQIRIYGLVLAIRLIYGLFVCGVGLFVFAVWICDCFSRSVWFGGFLWLWFWIVSGCWLLLDVFFFGCCGFGMNVLLEILRLWFRDWFCCVCVLFWCNCCRFFWMISMSFFCFSSLILKVQLFLKKGTWLRDLNLLVNSFEGDLRPVLVETERKATGFVIATDCGVIDCGVLDLGQIF